MGPHFKYTKVNKYTNITAVSYHTVLSVHSLFSKGFKQEYTCTHTHTYIFTHTHNKCGKFNVQLEDGTVNLNVTFAVHSHMAIVL